MISGDIAALLGCVKIPDTLFVKVVMATPSRPDRAGNREGPGILWLIEAAWIGRQYAASGIER